MTDYDKELDADREKSNKSKASSSKQKDLSHVPCKFFKVGACTAGSSCPFSHNVPEPGQSKDVCAWFVKGTCKFGHKCALAHILPGQNMSMDRKNKKAAQLAANGGANASGTGSGGKPKAGKKDGSVGQQGRTGATTGTPAHGRPGLLSGSTAPMRTASSRPPITMPPLKGVISPSAPAPPLKDTDFAAFVLSDDVDSPSTNDPTDSNTESVDTIDPANVEAEYEQEMDSPSVDPSVQSDSPTKARNPSPPTLPVSMPSAPRRPILSADAADLGPIGSPPRGSHLAHSPLSKEPAPSTFHAQRSLLTETRDRHGSGPGIASSLGSTQPQAWKSELGPVPSQVVSANSFVETTVGVRITRADKDRDRDGSSEEDFEEFLPSSLTDLLTPSERSRRMSRTHSNSSRPVNVGDTPSPHPPLHLSAQNQTHHAHHRYSRSVPAPSLLGDVKSIWAERAATNANNGLPGSPDKPSFGVGAIGPGTPSSLKSTNGLGTPGSNLTPNSTVVPFGTTPFSDDLHSSPSLLAPSNASAAFLPGLHHYYSKMNSANSRVSSTTNGLGIGGGLGGVGGLNRTPLPTTPLHPPAAEEGRTTTGIGAGLGESLSPSIRALQAHAPGQSLPQGLAAGYSRIHALPVATSPGSIGTSIGGTALSPGQGQVPFGINAGSNTGLGLGQDWLLHNNHHSSHLSTEAFTHLSLSSHQETVTTPSPGPVTLSSSMAALESMFSRLPSTSSPLRASPQASTTDRGWHKQGALSPLSRPVVTADDDDLFCMDG
ncbi:hypothetical protein V8B97DRAFT_377480 [Scleroderma yunnanense]